MRPGESTNVTLVMRNGGEDAAFALMVNTAVTGSNSTDLFEYILTPTATFLEQNSSTEINIEIILSSDATDGLAVTFTIVAESVNDNNFITLDVITTTRPPPEFIKNVRQGLQIGYQNAKRKIINSCLYRGGLYNTANLHNLYRPLHV